MRGLYVIWPDFEYIDRCIDSGIDTLLVSCYNFPDDGIVNSGFDTYQTSMSVIDRYRSKGIRCLLIPSYIRQWNPIPVGQQYINNGTVYPNTPCPNSFPYMLSRIQPALDLYLNNKVDGLIFDFEMYSGGLNYLDEKHKCECPNCNDLSWKEQWENNKKMMATFLRLNEIGTMPYPTYWGFRRLNADDISYYDEDYYVGFTWKKYFKTLKNRLINELIHDVNYKEYAGVWLEVLSYDDFFYSLNKISNSRVFDGWWIYSQKRLSKNSGITEEIAQDMREKFGMYEMSLVGDDFFARLKAFCNQ